MKKLGMIGLICSSVLLWGAAVLAAPLDWTGFDSVSPSDPVTLLDDTTIKFTEIFDFGAVFFFNDDYLVPNDATILSFDYEILLGSTDSEDFLTFYSEDNNGVEITDNEFPEYMSGDDPFGHFILDLTDYQGTGILLEWGFIEGAFDGSVNSTARVYNIDLAESASPVPEPATLILLGTGLAGLFGMGRKKILHRSS